MGEALFDEAEARARGPAALPATVSINLFLQLNNVDIAGEPLVTSFGRENSIECFYYEQGVTAAREVDSGMKAGSRQYAPIIIRKRIDRSSPLLAKGLTQNQVAEGTFKFYGPHWSGDGTIDQFYTVVFQQGRISALKQSTADGLIEEVAFVFQSISWTWTNGVVSHEDSWSAAG